MIFSKEDMAIGDFCKLLCRTGCQPCTEQQEEIHRTLAESTEWTCGTLCSGTGTYHCHHHDIEAMDMDNGHMANHMLVGGYFCSNICEFGLFFNLFQGLVFQTLAVFDVKNVQGFPSELDFQPFSGTRPGT